MDPMAPMRTAVMPIRVVKMVRFDLVGGIAPRTFISVRVDGRLGR